ncbi:MAG TPA: hypothetical protein PLE19_06725 [Planctomycetota bacterium]|nr:hypothetical protein [Planctomycetota bacterium]HRR80981.1 hypothetical protein [Planctomycetota bacterium]HRT96440.1 hypothetical protein [Planctomycetota bacterium]
MAQEAPPSIEDYQRRIAAQAAAVRELEELVHTLESGPAAGTEATQKSLSRAHADLERAEADLKALKRQYAACLLREGRGPDPAHVEVAVFDEATQALTTGRLTSQEKRAPGDGPIAFDAFRSLLLAGLPLGQLVENEAADRKSSVLFDSLEEQTSTKNILRRWAAMVVGDPYVANILRCAREAAARFRQGLEQFTRVLDGVRINYELKQRKVDRLAFAFSGSRAVIQASNDWENIERVCPTEAQQLVEVFHSLVAARDELRRLRDELNGELRAFMKCFFPRYLTYVLQQSKPRQHELGLGRCKPHRVCRYVLEQVDRTDFLLPRGGDLEIDVPRIPPEIALFRKVKSYVRHRKQQDHAASGVASGGEDEAM